MIEQINTLYGGNVNKARKNIREMSKAYPAHLIDITPPISSYSKMPFGFVKAMRSRDFMVQIVERDGFIRLSINRSDITGDGVWKDGITWDEIQRLKSEAGFGDRFAVECYPEDENVVYDANMRHIFILNERPSFAWTAANRAKK